MKLEQTTNNTESFHELNAEAIKEVIDDFAPVLAKIKKASSPKASYLYARQSLDNVIDRTKMFEKATCNSSCSFCCHDSIFVSHSEAEYIKQVVKSKGIVPNADRIALQKENNTHLKWEFKACPLLLDADAAGERKCSIYEDRPLICRAHNSTEDPKFCNKEEFPDRTIKELKNVLVDGILMASIVTGNRQVNPSEELMIALHNVL